MKILKIFLFIFGFSFLNACGLLTSADFRSVKLENYFYSTVDNADIRIKYESERLQDELLAVQGHAEKQYRKIHQLQYEIKQLESRLENLE